MEKKYKFLRSKWEFGEASECRRGLVCGMGYTGEELSLISGKYRVKFKLLELISEFIS